MNDTLLSRLADRFILCPTTHRIPVEGKSRRTLALGHDRIEIWMHRVRASLQKMPAVADAVFDELEMHAAGRPILVLGSSLGGASALYLAARRRVDGLIVRNAPPLRQVILGRFGWWNLNLGARLIARQVPDELCSIRNARRCAAPAVFVMSEKDRIVSWRYQRLVIDAYAGPKRLLVLPGADHVTAMTEDEAGQYELLLDWLRARIMTAGKQGEADVSKKRDGHDR